MGTILGAVGLVLVGGCGTADGGAGASGGAGDAASVGSIADAGSVASDSAGAIGRGVGGVLSDAGQAVGEDTSSGADVANAPDAGRAGTAADAGSTPDQDTGVAQCPEAAGAVVSFATEDGVTLEADYEPSGMAGGAAVVLLHMIPPSNSRKNYPPEFRELLQDVGLTVLNVDRRGAGGSQGVAAEAYTGPLGKWDARGAVDFLMAQPCAPDPSRIVLVGASNGTTTAVDYAVWAANSADAVPPAALVFLTGGGYTEGQNKVGGHAALIPLPVLFVFSSAEKTWSSSFEATAPQDWEFEEYSPGAHGTGMFGIQPSSMERVRDFVLAAVGE